MTLELGTPAVLFPALSLLMLSYGNRFLAVASLIRHLHHDYEDNPNPKILKQIKNLRRRIKIIRDMQTLSISSVFCSVLSIAFVYNNLNEVAQLLFGLAMLLMLISLGLSILETYISTAALDVELEDVTEDIKDHYAGYKKRIRAQRKKGIDDASTLDGTVGKTL
jgi:hypothetical protein